jgi:2-oxoglutarate ferredoxin oxidoreductase subunit alpha
VKMAKRSNIFKDEASIVLCGAAGQGIQTVEGILTKCLKLSGYNIFATKEFMSRIRGGANSTSIRVSSERVRAPVDRMDLLVPLSKGAVDHVRARLSEGTIVLGERPVYEEEYLGGNAIDVPLTKTAKEVGGAIYANTVASAILSRLFGVDSETLGGLLRKAFSDKGEDVVDRNLQAVKRGYEIGSKVMESEGIQIEIARDPGIEEEILINGTQSIAMGCLAGGCNYLSFYPMTPGTGVATFMAQHAGEFGTVVEQAEDEISVINMAIGSWYAGGRGMVTTSGGGFALMVEGVSLAAMLENPIVIHLSQRPGPATGLPTRTEQGDLLFALYSGHGEFPRVIYTPGNIEDAFYLSQRAFNIADQYQVPVFILTDQNFVDSYHNLPPVDVSSTKVEHSIVETPADYRRFAITNDGISPRGIPGFGKGLVCSDSDEHDEEGRITEDFNVRTDMVEKRLRKAEGLAEAAVPPDLIGDPDYSKLVLGWGSTYGAIREAVETLGSDETAFLHFKQVYPLPEQTREYLEKAEMTILVENNATAQFGKLLQLEAGMSVDRKILKWDGLAFSADALAGRLKEVLG